MTSLPQFLLVALCSIVVQVIARWEPTNSKGPQVSFCVIRNLSRAEVFALWPCYKRATVLFVLTGVRRGCMNFHRNCADTAAECGIAKRAKYLTTVLRTSEMLCVPRWKFSTEAPIDVSESAKGCPWKLTLLSRMAGSCQRLHVVTPTSFIWL